MDRTIDRHATITRLLGDYTSEGMTARLWTFCMNASGKWKVKIDETGWLYRILSGRYEIGFPRLCLRQDLIPLYDRSRFT